MKINILFGIVLQFLTTVEAQTDTILMQYPIGHCEIDSIPVKYVNQSLYACANTTINENSTVIIFSMEGLVKPVNKISMALDHQSSLVCFTYFPKRQQFKMCFNPLTKTQVIHSNDKQEIPITRGIFYGNISNFDRDIDEKVWPEPIFIPGYFQNDFYRTKLYHANEGDKVFIYYEVQSKPGYKLKLLVQEENEESIKWEKYNKSYIINKELIFDTHKYVEFLATKKLSYRVIVYTFVKNDIVNPSSIFFSVRVIKFPNQPRI